MSAFDCSFDTAGLIRDLEIFAARLTGGARRAAQAGAQVMYDEVLLNIPESDKTHVFYGTHQKYTFSPGTLRRSIYQVYSKDHSGYTHATYHVSWNHKECPYGFMVENGTSRAAAHPFIRKAWENRNKGLEEVMLHALLKGKE